MFRAKIAEVADKRGSPGRDQRGGAEARANVGRKKLPAIEHVDPVRQQARDTVGVGGDPQRV